MPVRKVGNDKHDLYLTSTLENSLPNVHVAENWIRAALERYAGVHVIDAKGVLK